MPRLRILAQHRIVVRRDALEEQPFADEPVGLIRLLVPRVDSTSLAG